MTAPDFASLLAPARWFSKGTGPRYRQLARHLSETIRSGALAEGSLLPPERELAERADVSRVTVRKAIAELAEDGLIRQRQGSGTYIEPRATPRLAQSLSSLVSFTETLTARGLTPSSRMLEAGLFAPSDAECAALSLGTGERVARVRRLRLADGVPLALETSSLPESVLPDPGVVRRSLYDVLRKSGHAPVRALQRVSAVALTAEEATLIGVGAGAAFLRIERTGYLPDGRAVEFTIGLYRSDIYDFRAEVRLETESP